MNLNDETPCLILNEVSLLGKFPVSHLTGTVIQGATLSAASEEAEGCVTDLVPTLISVQCHRCKHTHGSVLAGLPPSALPEREKESGIISWPVSRPHLARSLYSPASRPGDGEAHRAHNLFFYYRTPAAGVFNCDTFTAALR